jgi:dinuclear metal center YbgI/SA1388 family protein
MYSEVGRIGNVAVCSIRRFVIPGSHKASLFVNPSIQPFHPARITSYYLSTFQRINLPMPLVKDIIAALESVAHPTYQESYDNSGLQTGDPGAEVTGILCTLDVTEALLDEAIAEGCNLIVAHHPVIFGTVKRISSAGGYAERILFKAIRAGISIYATHTNLDNMKWGVNAIIAEKLDLEAVSVLQMKTDTLRKLYTFAPQDAAEKVREALFAAGAGAIGLYNECSFNTTGTGTFRPGPDADPLIGEPNGPREWVDEVKIEVIVQKHKEAAVLKALFEAHPYETVAFEFIHLHNANQEMGAGAIGTLKEAMSPEAFLGLVKELFGAKCIRHTAFTAKEIKKVALCGGSGSFLLKDAITAKADVFLTADYKYHQFFDADGRIMIADIGHWESEQFTTELLIRILRDKFPNFASLKAARTPVNPIQYFT